MRVISGFAKGKRLQAPPPRQQKWQEIRPTTDRAREALFSIIGSCVAGASVLDLFAGTGAMGLEAFSRGSNAILFLDKNPSAIALLKQNILSCIPAVPHESIIRVLQQDIRKDLDTCELPEELHRFDLIIADPPYDSGLSSYTIKAVYEQNLLKKGGVLVIEERSTTPLPTTDTGFHLIEKRIYGEVAFHLFENSQ